MPHTGKPSGACQNCKKRHIKCDEGRPACAKCVSTNRICSGYPEGLDLVLRDQTHSTKTAVQRRQKSTSRRSSPSASVPVPLSESEDSHALCFFVSSYVLRPHDPRTDRGITELLPLFFADMKPGTPLSLTLSAVSRSIFAGWERRVRNFEIPMTQLAYGKALTATRAALADPVQRLSDETLMAVCLLGMYEEVTHSFKGQVSPVRHFEGAAALIQQKNGLLASDLSKRLLIAVRTNIVHRAMHTATPIDTSSVVWEDPLDMPQNPATVLNLISVEVANVLALEKSILSEENSNATVETLSNVVEVAKTADARLATWPNFVPAGWLPKRVPMATVPESVTRAGVYGDGFDIYPDVLVCCTWNFWRSARLRLLALITRYEFNEEAIASIQELADGVCGTVPFILGDRTAPTAMFAADVAYPSMEGQAVPPGHHQLAAGFGGWYITTPIHRVLILGMYLREGQEAWLQRQGQRLGRIYDILHDETGPSL